MTIAFSCIRAIAVGRHPPSDATGQPRYGDDPNYIVMGSYDGSTVIVDLRDPGFTVELNRARSELSGFWTQILESEIDSD